MKQNFIVKQLLVVIFAIVGIVPMWGAEGDTHKWTSYTEWGISSSSTTSWLRNNNATLPTLKYTPSFPVKKITLNVRQSNATGSNSISVTVGGSSFGSTVGALSGTTAYDIEFTEDDAASGQIVITCTNNSGSGTGKGTFYINSITVTEGSDVSKTSLSSPTNLVAAPASTSADLSWTAVANAGSYKVDYKVSSAGAWTTVSPNPTTNSCTLNGLTASTVYAWQVTAVPSNTELYSNSPAASGANFTTLAPSATPLPLPHSWREGDGLSAYTMALGCTTNITAGDYSSAPKIKFGAVDNFLMIRLADAPGQISFNFKQNGSDPGTFLVQESSDGSVFTTAKTVDWPGNGTTLSIEVALQSSTRYIKLIITSRVSGTNAGVGGISITAAGSGKTSISVTPVAGEQSITVGGSTLDVSTLFTITDGYDGTPTYAITNGGSNATLEGTTLTAVAAGSVTITCTAPATRNYGPEASNTKDVTVNAAAAVERTVTWYVNSEEYTAGTPTTSVNDGSKVTTLPTEPTVPGGCSGKVFVGWTDHKITEAGDAPEVLFTDAAGAPRVSGGNANYYAVFADEN